MLLRLLWLMRPIQIQLLWKIQIQNTHKYKYKYKILLSSPLPNFAWNAAAAPLANETTLLSHAHCSLILRSLLEQWTLHTYLQPPCWPQVLMRAGKFSVKATQMSLMPTINLKFYLLFLCNLLLPFVTCLNFLAAPGVVRLSVSNCLIDLFTRHCLPLPVPPPTWHKNRRFFCQISSNGAFIYKDWANLPYPP